MTLERTFTHMVPKLWGSTDLRPWNAYHGEGAAAIGEIWMQRTDQGASETALLLKILFTDEPLSIQVHPNDAYARSIGLQHGKSEAWYILSANPGAGIALGLKRQVGPDELRASIDSGSVADLVQWRSVKNGEAILVSAGTVHAIGAGIVAVEIQQRSSTTFRLFDYGRQRELDPEHAVAAASGERAARQSPARKLTEERTLLVTDQHFMLERLQLPAGSDWELCAPTETWLFVLEGRGWVGELDVCRSEAIFLEADSARIRMRSSGMQCLVAYVGAKANPNLLRTLEGEDAGIPKSDQDLSFLQPDLKLAIAAPGPRA
jgi:mannose-6-phosphate isomerase